MLYQKIDSVLDQINTPIDSITVIGHTDDIGTDLYNDVLSKKRAQSVSEYISSLNVVTGSKIQFYGKGSKYPIDNNSSDYGRSRNRRVEIIIKYINP